MAFIKVTMEGKKYEKLAHALHALGFKPNGSPPYDQEIDIVWRAARKDLKINGVCTVIGKDNNAHTIALT